MFPPPHIYECYIYNMYIYIHRDISISVSCLCLFISFSLSLSLTLSLPRHLAQSLTSDTSLINSSSAFLFFIFKMNFF